MWLDEVVLRAIEVCVPLWSHIKTRLSLLSRHTLIWTCTRSSYDVDSQSSCPWMDWWTLLFWVSSLIALCILFLRANFTSNTRWESQTFHHDENSPRLYLGGFSKSFGLESSTFPDFLNKITYITQYYVQIWHHTKRNGGVIENAAMSLKFSEGDLIGIPSHNLKNHCKYFV